jgi:hypothetical protein
MVLRGLARPQEVGKVREVGLEVGRRVVVNGRRARGRHRTSGRAHAVGCDGEIFDEVLTLPPFLRRDGMAPVSSRAPDQMGRPPLYSPPAAFRTLHAARRAPREWAEGVGIA